MARMKTFDENVICEQFAGIFKKVQRNGFRWDSFDLQFVVLLDSIRVGKNPFCSFLKIIL